MSDEKPKVTISVNGGPEYDVKSPEAIRETGRVIARAHGIPERHADAATEEMIAQEQARVDQEKAAKPELPGIGHNSEEGRDVGGVAGKRLKSFIERVERLAEEQAAIGEDIKDVYGECKATGFDVKIVRKIVRLRKMDIEKRREEDELLELYKAAIGME